MDEEAWLENVHSPFRSPVHQALPVDTLMRCCIGLGLTPLRIPLVGNHSNVTVAHGGFPQHVETMF